MSKQTQQQRNDYEQPRDSNQYRVRIGWFVIPFVLIGLYALYKSAAPAITWDHVMDFLHVHNKSRYSMLAIWCLSLVLITSLWRILRK